MHFGLSVAELGPMRLESKARYDNAMHIEKLTVKTWNTFWPMSKYLVRILLINCLFFFNL